jgi:hypothetical protein
MSQKDDVKWYTDQNLERVKNLIALYSNNLAGNGSGRKHVNFTDILRADIFLCIQFWRASCAV